MDLVKKLVTGEKALRRWLWASLVCNMAIVVTGAIVRLTSSGLGCPTWPKCTDESYVPHPESGIHGLIEFGNRTLTFVLIAVALGAFFAAWVNRGRRSTLWRLTLGIGIGIPFQGVIGGITVWSGLNPFVVALHLLLSVVLIVACVLALRIGYRVVPTPVGRAARLVVVATFASSMLSIWVGTVVTGSGPHAGDLDAVRTGFDIQIVSRLHGLSAWLVVASTVASLWLLRGTGRPAHASRLLLGTVLLQGVIGYTQYFLGVPAWIVALHMVGMTLVAAASAWLLFSTAGSPAAPTTTDPSRSVHAEPGTD